jgi:hypothetical protein
VSRERRNREDIYQGRLEIGRYYVAYDALEEFHAGMWRRVSGEREVLRLMAAAVRLLRDPADFRAALDRVLAEWPVSCRSEFTRAGSHVAWLGQAACCIAGGVPEAMTRRAWWKLTPEEQDTANAIAGEAEQRFWDSRQLSLFARAA